KGKLAVGHDGTITWQAEGGDKHVMFSDGARTQIDAKSGTSVFRGADDKIQEVTAGNGSTTSVEYGENGQVSRVSSEARGAGRGGKAGGGDQRCDPAGGRQGWGHAPGTGGRLDFLRAGRRAGAGIPAGRRALASRRGWSHHKYLGHAGT